MSTASPIWPFRSWSPDAPIFVVVRRWPGVMPVVYFTPAPWHPHRSPDVGDETEAVEQAARFYDRNEAQLAARWFAGQIEPANDAARAHEAALDGDLDEPVERIVELREGEHDEAPEPEADAEPEEASEVIDAEPEKGALPEFVVSVSG